MSIPGDASPLLLGGGPQQYKIERSLRFNSSDSAYLSRTPASAGNKSTWTWAGWVKRSQLSTQQSIFGNTPADKFRFRFETGNTLRILDGTNAVNLDAITTQLYRDTAAWYHIVLVVDTTQGTGSNRVKVYVNGVQQSLTYTNTPSLNQALGVNDVSSHSISNAAGQGYCDFYLADIHFIDGQALTPSSFAETNITTGQWVPKAYTGTYGTNGFRLAFADNSNNTATTLGKDSSPNGNNWTPNNLSVTAGAGNDSLVDTPTSYGTDTGAGGEVRGNYATLNPLDKSTNITLTNGNLNYAQTTINGISRSTLFVSTGKWYWEYTSTGTYGLVGIANASNPLLDSYLGASANGYSYLTSGQKLNNGSLTAYGATWTSGDTIGIALDLDAGTLVFYKNGASQGTAFSSLSGSFSPAAGANNTSMTGSFNFGQRPFAYTAPSGFKALCDTNLPAPVVAKPNTVMDVALWSGNNTGQTITLPGAFSPDLIWTKVRNAANNHWLFDIVRGTDQGLSSSTTGAELTRTSSVTAFGSTGFTLGTSADVNSSAYTYVGWCWDAGSSTATNTQGSITSQVRANASAGFSIVTYTGNSTAGATVGHGLGVAPQLVITKARSAANGWAVYHQATGNAQFLSLESTAAASTNSTAWNNTSPSSSVVTFGTGTLINANAITYVAYCFAPVAGYSSFGSYTGNGSTDGPFVYTGFRPRWIIIKSSSIGGASGYDWIIHDTSRSVYNFSDTQLIANSSVPENQDSAGNSTSGFGWDILSNGFKIRTSTGGRNQSGQTYIYAAFAENPFQYARAR